MIGVGTCSRVARPRVSGAIRMRLGAWIAPSWIESKRLGIGFPFATGCPPDRGRSAGMHDEPRQSFSTPPSSEVPPLALAALLVANAALAFGPWFVRLADVGPVAVGFWRIALAMPVLLAIVLGSGWRPVGLGRSLWVALALGGLCFAADLASWHIGILRTTLANATLFGNSATLFYPIYGFVIARSLPTRTQGL